MKWKVNLLILILSVSAFIIITQISTVMAQSTVEIAYDDGTASGSTSLLKGEFMAVRFSLPSGWSEVKLITARYDVLAGAGSSFRVHILDSDGATPLITPFEVTPTQTGWFDVDLSGFDLTVTDDFYIAIEFIEDENPWIGYDKTDPDGQSYYGQPADWTLWEDMDIMIRAVVQQPLPVGGVILPIPKLSLFTLYIAILIAAVSLTLAMKKRVT